MLVGGNLVVRGDAHWDIASIYSQICLMLSESVMYKLAEQSNIAICHFNEKCAAHLAKAGCPARLCRHVGI